MIYIKHSFVFLLINILTNSLVLAFGFDFFSGPELSVNQGVTIQLNGFSGSSISKPPKVEVNQFQLPNEGIQTKISLKSTDEVIFNNSPLTQKIMEDKILEVRSENDMLLGSLTKVDIDMNFSFYITSRHILAGRGIVNISNLDKSRNYDVIEFIKSEKNAQNIFYDLVFLVPHSNMSIETIKKIILNYFLNLIEPIPNLKWISWQFAKVIDYEQSETDKGLIPNGTHSTLTISQGSILNLVLSDSNDQNEYYKDMFELSNTEQNRSAPESSGSLVFSMPPNFTTVPSNIIGIISCIRNTPNSNQTTLAINVKRATVNAKKWKMTSLAEVLNGDQQLDLPGCDYTDGYGGQKGGGGHVDTQASPL